MIITGAEKFIGEKNMRVAKFQNTEFFWDGLIYVPGFKAGADTVAALAKMFHDSGTFPFAKLRGSFHLIVRTPDRVLAFTDNSQLSAIYVHPQAVSTRVLPLVQLLSEVDSAPLNLSTTAIAQAYAVGRIVTEETLIESITLLDSDKYLEFREGGLTVEDKGIDDIDHTESGFTPEGFFDALAVALDNGQVSCALTGGYDSRMVYAFLANRMSPIPTLSGDAPITADARVGAKVARVSGRALQFIKTPMPSITDKYLQDLFVDQDGMPGFNSDSSIRLHEYYSKLASLGITTHLTGDGGVLHKDWEWIQDFPRYRSRRTNLGRFIRQRITFNFDAKGAGALIQADLNGLFGRLSRKLHKYLAPTNTQSYDKLYWHVNGRRTSYYNAVQHVNLYAPLLERDFVAYSYALPRKRRFFNFQIRHLITGQNAAVARVATSYGMTASSELRYVTRDVFYQLRDYMRRATRLVGRYIMGRTPLLESAISWSSDEAVRSSELVGQAVAYARKIGLIEASASAMSLSRAHLDCLLQVFLTARTARLVDCEESSRWVV